MLLQKTLHMNQSLDECKSRLASIQSYRRQFVMVTKATVTSSKTVDFSFRGPLGFEARTVLLSVGWDPAELHGGDARLALRDQEQTFRLARPAISFCGCIRDLGVAQHSLPFRRY